MELEELTCFDCDVYPIVAIVCDSCREIRRKKDGPQWYDSLMAEFSAAYPNAVPTKRTKRKDRVITDWLGNEIKQ